MYFKDFCDLGDRIYFRNERMFIRNQLTHIEIKVDLTSLPKD